LCLSPAFIDPASEQEVKMDIEVLIRRKEEKTTPGAEEERRRIIDTMIGPDRIHYSSHTVTEQQLQELLRYIARH
jgi:hypothetical protein